VEYIKRTINIVKNKGKFILKEKDKKNKKVKNMRLEAKKLDHAS